MTRISVLGLGAMGSRMASNLMKAGYAVTVWNRTVAAAAPLVEAGARLATTPRDAATDADFVIAMLRDDQASRHVWLDPEVGALAGMAAACVGIESSTLTPGWIRELGERMSDSGLDLLEAPVAGSRPQAEAGQLVYLVGGDGAVLAKTEPVLKVMGSTVHHVGALGSGALVKLSTNALLGVQVTLLAELLPLLKRGGADVAKAIQAIATTAVWSPAATNISNGMMSGAFAPMFPVELIEKDFGYAVNAAGSDQAVPTIAAARDVFKRAIEQGYGADNMTGVVRLYEK